MKSFPLAAASVCACALLLCGCYATPIVTPVSIDAQPPAYDVQRKELPGIPFRVPAEQTVRIYQWDFETEKYQEVASSRQVLADYSRLYAIDVRASSFASPSLHVAQNPDNTLKVMGVTSTASASAASALAGASASVGKAQTDKATQVLTANTAVATAQKNLRDAINSLAGLASNTSAEVRQSYQATIDTARQQLNAACAAAAAAGDSCQ